MNIMDIVRFLRIDLESSSMHLIMHLIKIAGNFLYFFEIFVRKIKLINFIKFLSNYFFKLYK